MYNTNKIQILIHVCSYCSLLFARSGEEKIPLLQSNIKIHLNTINL
jgi:hypothetical protein